MGERITIEMDEHLAQFVADQVEAGKFTSPAEVFRAGVELLEQQDPDFLALREAIEEGLASGISHRTVEDIWREVLEEEYGKRGG